MAEPIINLLVSMSPMETAFCNMLEDRLTPTITKFNRVQFNILVQKHKSRYCMRTAMDVCLYQMEIRTNYTFIEKQIVKDTEEFNHDFKIFFKKELLWSEDAMLDFLLWFQNVLRTIFMGHVENVTGLNLYDSRQYVLRGFKFDRTVSSATERILSIEYQRKENTFI